MLSYLKNLISQEEYRQESCINLIASENYVSPDIMEITGSVLTNKYAEGYPGQRYYAGCHMIDEIESLAINECNKLFQSDHSNVQPHAGSSANFAAYLAIISPGETILSMSLSMGGHLTHGHKVNFSGKFYTIIHYGVDQETECINYQTIEELAEKHSPKLIVAGASAYSRLIDYERIATIAHRHGALFLYDMAHIAGLVAAGSIPSPVPHADIVTSTTHKTLRGPRGGLIMCKQPLAQAIDRAVMPGSQGGPLMHVIAAKAAAFILAQTEQFKKDQEQTIILAQIMSRTFQELGYRVVSGGTDNHLFMLDLRCLPKSVVPLTGKMAQELLESCGLIVNMNMVPFDTQKPTITSGIRIGTAAIATRQMGTPEAQSIAQLIHEIFLYRDNQQKLAYIKAQVIALSTQFPVYKKNASTLLNNLDAAIPSQTQVF